MSEMPKIMVLRCIFYLLLISFQHPAKAQNTSNLFHPGKILLSEGKVAGNFGEIRGNHFHSGIDYKTNETEGWPVLAAEDGYVSRVKINANGYGKALYITHPGGIVTVYGHLREFYPAVADTVKSIQNEKHQFEIEFFPAKDQFKVTNGQLIAFSGATGGADGPHLHFETRYTAGEKPFNPELIGYLFPDTIPPVINSIVIYKPGPYNGLFGSEPLVIDSSQMELSSPENPILCNRDFFLGFEGYDLAGNEPNHLGIRSFKTTFNDSVFFQCSIDSFGFDETRFVNAILDFQLQKSQGKQVIICFALKGNKSPLYANYEGLMHFEKAGRLTLELEDFNGNKKTVNLYIAPKPLHPKIVQKLNGNIIRYDYESIIKNDFAAVTFGKKSFYEDVNMEVNNEIDTDSAGFSNILKIVPDYIAIHDPILIRLKLIDPNRQLNTKLLVVKVDSTGGFDAVGGEISDGWISVKTRELGTFKVIADTTPPVIMDPFFEEDVHSGNLKLVIPFKKDLTGVKKYNCVLNDDWVCGEYYTSRNRIEIFMNHKLQQGELLNLEVDAEDGMRNRTSYKSTISYHTP